MPRVSAQHEQAVRDRIVRAAIEVFAEHGFHRATMQDIVRRSGLSVGAIYTYFKSKSDLILAGCDLITDQELGELRERLATVTDYRERVATALGFFFDQFEEQRSGRGTSVLMTQAWAEVEADPAIREMVRRRRREIVGPTALLLQEGVVRGELPAWLDVESVAHAIAALLDGITIEAIEDGAGVPPGGRRAAGPRDARAALRGSRRRARRRRSKPVAPRAVRLAQGEPRVVTDGRTSRPSAARSTRAASGSRCPTSTPRSRCGTSPIAGTTGSSGATSRSSPTSCVGSRQSGGSAIVDLTLPGVGRDPAWLVRLVGGDRPPHRHGRGLVSRGVLPRRGPHRPPVGRRPRRRDRPRRDRRRRREPASGPGSSARSARTSRGCRRRRSASIGPRPEPRGGPASRSRPTRSSRASGWTSSTVFEAEGADLTRVVIGHADSYPDPDYHLAIVERGASVEFDFLGMSFTPLERHGEGRIVESICDLLARGPRRADPPVAGRLPRLAADPLRRQRLHVPRRHVPAAPPGGRRLRRRDPDDHGRQPAAAADDRLSRRQPPRGWRAPGSASSVASTESSTLPFRAFEIGQPSLAFSAASRKLASVAPGHDAAAP